MKYFLYCRKSTESEDRQVMSLDSQRGELERAFGARPDIEIVDIITEAKSAKDLGRPRFNQMIARIEQGEAEGIIAWAPDRLARNSVDGGRIVYLLDKGVLNDLKFSTYTFENNSQGKFMLAIMFGQSKYYSDALSENVRRGLRTKLEKGWLPGPPPIGYRTNPATREIEPHPDYFPFVRRMFELVMDGHSPAKVTVIARDEWGFRMPANRRSCGKPISLSNVQRTLRNPFYSGLMVWKGVTYEGRHRPMVTPVEFASVQRQICRPAPAHPQKHWFAYTGMIRCAKCGLQITAQNTINRFGTRYTYYHCTQPGVGQRCDQPSIREEELERQILGFLGRLSIHPNLQALALAALSDLGERELARRSEELASLRDAISVVDRDLRELTRLKLLDLLSDEEFSEERKRLVGDRQTLEFASRRPPLPEPAKVATTIMALGTELAERFACGNRADRSAIFRLVGVKPTLSNKILNVEAARPFKLIYFLGKYVVRWRERHAFQTPSLSTEIGRFADEWLNWVRECPEEVERLYATAADLISKSDHRPAA